MNNIFDSNNKIFFECPMNDHYIEFKKNNNNICWIEKIYIDSDNPKTFFALLRSAITILKKNYILKYQQILTYYDYDILKKKTNLDFITVLNDDLVMQTKLVECDIEDALIILETGILNE